MIMVIKRVEYGISYHDLIKENFRAQIKYVYSKRYAYYYLIDFNYKPTQIFNV